MDSSLDGASIIAHLGGEEFLTSLGARDFVVDKTHVSFRLAYPNPGDVALVAISIETNGNLIVTCFGHILQGSLQAPVLGRERVPIAENLAAVVGRLSGIDILQHRHL